MRRSAPSLTAPRPAARPRRRWWTAAAAAAVLAAFAYLFAAGRGGWLALQRQRSELAGLEVEVARLKAQNDSLRQVLWRVEHDPEYLEKVAREQHRMVRPGERLYLLKGTGGGR